MMSGVARRKTSVFTSDYNKQLISNRVKELIQYFLPAEEMQPLLDYHSYLDRLYRISYNLFESLHLSLQALIRVTS